MSVSVEQVVVQLRGVIDKVDAAAVAARHAEREAREARTAYAEAARGTDHPKMNQAVTGARTAAEKAGKTARLLAQAAQAFAEYINIIAPGAGPTRAPMIEAMPSGEQLLEEAEQRGGRLDLFIRRNAKETENLSDSVQETTKSTADGVKAIARIVHRKVNPPAGHATTASVSTEPPQPTTASAPDMASALAVSAMIVVYAQKGIRGVWKKMVRRERRSDD